ncbi:hypothetical protein GCM10027446_26550 [Angustibacter peucedani]
MPHVLAFRRPARTLVAAVALAAVVTPLAGVGAAGAAAPARPRPVGIDVSRWQSAGPSESCDAGALSWSRVASTSRGFVIIRATRTSGGVTSRDACFARNWAGAEAHGLYRGAYHYAIPSKRSGSATRDAQTFVAVTGRMQDPGDLPPVLDLEVTGGLTPAQLSTWARTWLTTVRRLTGRQPMIYTSPSFWRSALHDSQGFHAYPLWIAHWQTKTPSIPGGWPNYAVHQYSATGRVSGIGTDVDLDVFNGTSAQLHAFAHPGTASTATTTSPVAYRGSAWQVAGRLRTERGVPVRDVAVRLYRQVGNGAWTSVASTRTSAATGSYRFVLHPTAAARYRVWFAGTTTIASSWSPVRAHEIRDRTLTTLTSKVDRTTVHAGSAVRLAGTALTTQGHAPLVRRTVVVYQRVGSGAWTAVRSITTSASTGRYATVLRPKHSSSFKVVLASTYSTAGTTSPARLVRVVR